MKCTLSFRIMCGEVTKNSFSNRRQKSQRVKIFTFFYILNSMPFHLYLFYDNFCVKFILFTFFQVH